MVKVDGKVDFMYDDHELSEVTKGDEEAQYMEIFEGEDLLLLEKNLNKFDLTIKEFFKEDLVNEKDEKKGFKEKSNKDKEPEILKPIFAIESEKNKNEFFSLKEIFLFIKDQAQKGIDIQRYKGLGEMNPHQLWETTMDPAKRTILKISLDDVVAADKTFNILMGDEVGPRKEFIETFAHEVKNLDV